MGATSSWGAGGLSWSIPQGWLLTVVVHAADLHTIGANSRRPLFEGLSSGTRDALDDPEQRFSAASVAAKSLAGRLARSANKGIISDLTGRAAILAQDARAGPALGVVG